MLSAVGIVANIGERFESWYCHRQGRILVTITTKQIFQAITIGDVLNQALPMFVQEGIT